MQLGNCLAASEKRSSAPARQAREDYSLASGCSSSSTSRGIRFSVMYQGIATEQAGVPIKGHASSSRAAVWRKAAERLACAECGVRIARYSPVTLRPTSRGDNLADLWNRMTNVAVGTARKPYPVSSGNPLTLDGESP